MCSGSFCQQDDLECPPFHFGHIQRKNYFKFRAIGTPASVPIAHFHRRGRRGKRYLQRRFLRKCGAAEGTFGKKMKFTWIAKGSPFEERLPPRRGKMARKRQKGESGKSAGFDGEGEAAALVRDAFFPLRSCNLCNYDNFW